MMKILHLFYLDLSIYMLFGNSEKYDFYRMSFSGGEQGAIVEQTAVNEDNPKYVTEGGNDTRDKVFLLSIGEVGNPEYGFCEDYYTHSVSRCREASDYAYVRGAWAGNCEWWLRSHRR